MAKKNIIDKRKETQRNADDRFTWRVLSVMVFLAAWFFLIYRFDWHAAFYALPAGLAVLYLLAFIYPKDFIALALLISGGTFGLWCLSALSAQSSPRQILPAYIIFGGAIALSFLITVLLKRKNGTVTFGRKSVTVIPRKGSYLLLFIACGALTAALVAAAVFGHTVIPISMAALFCYLFVAAVYYTVRLI
jgi:hypothetical protein